MKLACHTDSSNPSQSVVKSIAYPEAYRFSSKATSWGCKHEKPARDFYMNVMIQNHSQFTGVVEIKCPFCHQKDNILESLDDKKFRFKIDTNGCIFLDHGHAYYCVEFVTYLIKIPKWLIFHHYDSADQESTEWARAKLSLSLSQPLL